MVEADKALEGQAIVFVVLVVEKLGLLVVELQVVHKVLVNKLLHKTVDVGGLFVQTCQGEIELVGLEIKARV